MGKKRQTKQVPARKTNQQKLIEHFDRKIGNLGHDLSECIKKQDKEIKELRRCIDNKLAEAEEQIDMKIERELEKSVEVEKDIVSDILALREFSERLKKIEPPEIETESVKEVLDDVLHDINVGVQRIALAFPDSYGKGRWFRARKM